MFFLARLHGQPCGGLSFRTRWPSRWLHPLLKAVFTAAGEILAGREALFRPGLPPFYGFAGTLT
jgi:hypothetical protein